MDELSTLNYLWKKLEQRKLFDKYPENDCRNDYYGYSYDVMRNYYQLFTIHSIIGNAIDDLIKCDPTLKPKEVHINNILNVYSNNTLTKSYNANMNRSIIVDGLAAFETSITEVLKSLSQNNSSSKKTLHANINDLFIRLGNNYRRDHKEDIKFLDFFRRLRNALHSNWYYYGSNYTYTFFGREFLFEKYKVVHWEEPKDSSHNLYFEMMSRLNDIFDEIAHACGDKLLPYLKYHE